MEGAAAGETGPLHHAVRNRERAARRRRLARLGLRRKASRSSSSCRPKACSTRSSSRACSIRPISNSAKRPSASSRPSSACSPARVVLDSLSEIRLLAQSSLRYRRQILALKHYFAQQRRDRAAARRPDRRVRSTRPCTASRMAVIRLEELAPNYGAERRRLRVVKYRGRRFRGGYHDFVIETGGVRVFPRLVSAEHRADFAREVICSGNARARRAARRRRRARLEHAHPRSGRHRQVAADAAPSSPPRSARGERAAMFVFDEELGLLFDRAKGLGIDLAGDGR